MALLLLRQCGSFCKMVHLARSTPPSLMADALQMFDNDIHHAFAECTAVDAFGNSWQQAQLSLSRGGLGLRSLSHHSAAAYISSVKNSAMSHLFTSVNLFNALIPPADVIILDDIVSSPCRLHTLSSKIENHQFQLLFDHSSLPDRAHLLSVSSPNAAAWLSVIPSPGLNLHMDPPGIPNCLKMVAGYGFGSGPQLHLLPKSWLGSLGPPCHYFASMGVMWFPATINSVTCL